ncbi:LOW QUALITY PROTEIN: mucin-5AC [Marmota monax]|uniref:LOW QUALITY PROTEIN: mucin-5AC n=1 Tax=Marmota monax TaxID=9995 RepID=UPI0026F34A19|nr:LOW QUALITY PROTEIN: mucin-5AC [Marmota monax]
MAVGRRKLAPLWALAWALACTQHTGQAQQGSLQPGREHSADLSPLPGHSGDPLLRMTDTPPLRTIPVVQALNRAHNGRVCSTWGDFHYKTFDGDIFRFPGLCNYVFSAHCGAAYEDFNVQLRRSRAANTTTLSRVIMKLDGLVIELNESSVLVNGHPVQLPFSQSGVLMERSNGNLKVTARLGLVFMWDQDDDSLLLELDSKFANQTCGLCGDFNGIPVFSEFFSHDVRLTPIEFGNLQKMDGPTEQCRDPDPAPQNCSTGSGICEELLRGQLFSGCAALVDVSSYVEACRQDLCLCEQADLPSCICHTLAEYSRQCAHAGGLPQDWRGPDLCYQTCPLNMQHQECGSPCTDTCSNPQRSQLCEDHCVAGCFCPEGTVFDDIGQTGCVPMSQCSCLYNGTSYAPGANYSTDCTHTCSGGRWSCQEVPCQGTCSVLGGSHLSTFDEKQYTVHGDCSYVLTKPCNDDAFTVLAELRRCGLTESETCLKGVELRLGGGPTAVVVKASGEVFVNQIYTQLPVSTANVTLFRPSTFFIIAQTNLGVQLAIQLVPTMQVFVRLAPELRGLTCGLCGNFNSIQADDFRTNSGVVEGTGAAFANTWKTQAACPNVKSSFEDPCSLSVENEKYAQHWCSQLTSPDGPFAQCHATVSPSTYYSNCMFDTCNCEKSEDCMCAALSSYVQACAAKGVLLRGWRAGVCTKPTTTCPKSMTYHYHISTCQPTCRALSEEDVTCHVSFVPVDGCACPEGMFLDASDKCVPAASCPCYHRGSMVPNGESLHDSGAVCTCTQGTLTCIGGPAPTQVCDAPMVYVDCHNATHGATGAGCQKSCHTLDLACYSPQCEPGCVCPPGLVADGSGGCIAAEDCPCMHNGASYRPGETIWAGCNTCTCENRMWRCTEEPCLATCALYGDGHFLTFDGQRYTFSGDCQYTLVQDHCGGNGSAKDAFRVVTENVPCGTTGTTCSKDIKIFLGSYELKLSSGKVEVVQKGAGQEPPYTIRQMGIYLVVDTDAGLVLLWDRRTSIFLRLSPEFKGRVCGLCGNFDGNALNDFTTRSQAVVSDVLEFGNSWKLSPSCPDAPVPKDPCTSNPYRKAWAQKQCSIIHSATFATCHAHVEPTMYYEACVGDACACDSGGDCECFCTAVAAYAQACHEAGVCVSWRTPDVCPLFCDYYNPQGECEWHFQPCGAPCMRTCRNPSGRCLHDLRGLEGCYPKCPPSAPIFDEDKMQCVDKCSTPTPPPPCRIHGKSYRPGATVPSDKNCYSCICTENGVHCAYDSGACVCTYDGRHFHPGDVIYNTTDGMGSCISAHCRANGTVERRVFTCSPTTPRPPTTFSFSTSPVLSSRQTTSVGSNPTQSTVHSVPVSTASSTATGTPLRTTPATSPVSPSAHCGEKCLWSPWLDVSRPGQGVDSGDFDTLQNLRAHGFRVCQVPRAVECRAEDAPEVPLQALGQHLECSPTAGLTCHNRDQASGLCRNYQIRVLCCSPLPCPTSSPPATHRITNTGASTSEGPSTASPVTTSGLGTVPTTSTTVSSTPVRTSFLKSNPTPRPKTTSGTSSASASPPGTSQVTDVPTTSGISPVSCLRESCTWTQWMDGSYPGPGRDSGDFDTFHNLRSEGYKFCERPTSVECRAQFFPNTPLAELGQQVTCNSEEGLICWNRDQLPPICYNYEIRIQCCELVDYCRNETIGTPKSIATHPKSLETSATTKTTVTTGSQATSTGHTIHPTPVHTSRGTSVGTKVTQSTHSTPQTTDCQPQCTWTKWFDVDFPDPGPHGGDTETYSNILSKGERICLQPEDITRLECRAENHPEVSIEALGQVVQCEPHMGLVCRNQEQRGPLGMCLNYEVRVLCCHTPNGCQTTGTPAWTVPPEPSSSVPSTSAVASPWSPSSAPSSTLPCFCSVLDQLYPAGSIIYRQRDLSGHCYYALCSQDCEVIKGVDHDCPSTTPPPTSVSSLSMSTPETGCPNVLPPREKGESWAMPNCTQATCEGSSIISLRPRKCPEVKEPTCANGYPALKVADQDGCCQHYQCQCVCSGWGDPHYITFDGTYYTFLDNCTYVLVQQVVPVYGHFRVLINNDFCDPKDQLSCPQAIIVEYHQDRVVLTRTSVGGVMTNQIIFNNKVVSPGFQSNGIAVSRVGIKMYVTIREIGVQVMFSGLIFSVEVPFSTFANNTEGQCGTCTNDKRDECRLPGGTVAPSCSAMSGHWKVDVPGQPYCHGPTPTPPSTTPQTTPVQCPPSPLCELILSKVFQPCHHVISPQSFYEGCVFDYCHMTPLDVVCSGLQLYAALCASEGVCIDWRGHTNHACPFTCSAGKVYLPCGPSSLPYCYGKDSTSSLALPEAGPITEGCFCPENTMLFSSDAQVCVPANCSWCLGPHGEPVEPGHTISTDCQECTCKDSSQNMTCHRKPCPLPPACPLPGLVPVPTAPKAGQCCPQFVCACNTSYCPEPQHCPKGSRLVLTHEEGACCPSQICRGIGCNVNGTVYQPGAMVSSSLCERCWCEATGSPPSGSFLVSCETQICNTHCPLGFEYQAQMGRCCGKCVAVSCVVNTSRGHGHFLHPGESWSDPENRCVTYRCEKHQDRLEVVTVEKQCAALSCARDQARLSSDGCCFICPHVETSCMLHHRNQTIRQGSCSSAGPVRLSYCQGNCGNSTSMYSLDSYTVERKCQCCQELRTSQKKVSLTCADGSSRTFSYTQAEACGCLGQQCHSPADTSHGSSESESKKSKEQSQESESSSWEGLLRPPQ